MGLKFQLGVRVAALRANRSSGAGPGGIELAAADAVKGQLPAFRLKECVIAAIIVDPDPEKKREDEQAVDGSTDGKVHVPERRETPARSLGSAPASATLGRDADA
jgi:hypothetical protein